MTEKQTPFTLSFAWFPIWISEVKIVVIPFAAKKILLTLIFVSPFICLAQSDQHYTMFMYNKLLYNPGYTGSRDVTSANADYRDQWDAINGAPKTMNITLDAPVGSYMKTFRKVALGFSMTNETLGVEHNTDAKAYYAYRIKFKEYILSLGLSAGADLYSANYNRLNLFQANDPNFNNNIRNAMLPNFGFGAYLFTDKLYIAASAPNLLQNAYDKKEAAITHNFARQSGAAYTSAGVVFPINESIKLEPQYILRAEGGTLPFSADLNISAIYMDRLLVGISYRTDKSFEAIVHLQATQKINIGYAYDYLLSGLNGYSGGTHELVVGYDFVKDNSKFQTPRFIKTF